MKVQQQHAQLQGEDSDTRSQDEVIEICFTVGQKEKWNCQDKIGKCMLKKAK